MSDKYIDSMDKDIYIDPEEVHMKKILKELEGIGDQDKIQALIVKSYPTWLLHSTDKYSVDYPHLDKNWSTICDKNGVKKGKIVIVDAIIKDNDHLLINIFCERMTREGYVVRRRGELIDCQKCGAAIPSKIVYKHMKAYNLPVPNKWSDTCSTCVKDKK